MKLLDDTTYRRLMKYVEGKALALNHHEREFASDNPDKRSLDLHNIVQTNFPLTQCLDYNLDGFFLIFNNRFIQAIELYEKCFKDNPNLFHSGNVLDILKYLYEHSYYWSSFEDYKDYLQTEACCYIILKKDSEFGDILRIDLFRQLNKNDEGFVFTGGLFHCLGHFSMNGINLCNRSDINETFDILHVVYIIGRCFLLAINSNSKEGILSIDNNHFFKATFYYEDCSSVYFIKTIRIAKPEKERKKRDF